MSHVSDKRGSAAASVLDDFFQLGFEFFGQFRVLGDDVVSLGGIIGEVEELELGDLGVCKLAFYNDVAGAVGVAAVKFPIANAQAVGSRVAIVLGNEMVAALGIVLAQQGVDDIEAVGEGVIREFGADEFGEAVGKVDGADDLFGFATGGDATFPASDEGGACTAFIDAVFATGERAGGAVVAEFFEGFVSVAVVHDGAVVRAEHEEGVFVEAETVDGFHEFTDTPVELDDGVGAKAMGGGTLETFVRDAGDVDVVR